MLEGKVFTLVIDKEMIEKGSILEVAKAIYKMESAGVDAFQKIAITFHGYNDSKTEVWETPEIRKWCGRLINKIPHLFYYIENDHFQTQQTLMLCLNDYSSVYAGERKTPEEWGEELEDLEDVPQHKILINVHRKSMMNMFSEIRKHGKAIKKGSNATKVISEMSKRYGVSTD
jgi:hypothetical protein